MIDRMMRSTLGRGRCELCEKEIATRRAKFKAKYVETTSFALMDEETLSSVDLERRVCEGCLEQLKNSKNVSDLVFERL